MRFVRHSLLAAAVGLATAGGAAAQSAGGTTTPAGTNTGGSTGSGTTSGGGSLSSGGGQTGSTTAAAATPDIAGGDISGISSATPASGGVVDKSNFLGGTFSNPYYQGLYSNPNSTPGNFGSLLFGTAGGGGSPGTTSTTATGTGSSARINSAGRTTAGGASPFGTSASPFGTTGATARGGQAARGGGFGAAATSQFGGQVIPLPRNIAYQAVLEFPAPVVAPAQRLTDVQAVIARSSMIANRAGVSVVADGPVFVLRGQVASASEARLAEGMVRLTPGVREVRNELTFPKQ